MAVGSAPSFASLSSRGWRASVYSRVQPSVRARFRWTSSWRAPQGKKLTACIVTSCGYLCVVLELLPENLIANARAQNHVAWLKPKPGFRVWLWQAPRHEDRDIRVVEAKLAGMLGCDLEGMGIGSMPTVLRRGLKSIRNVSKAALTYSA